MAITIVESPNQWQAAYNPIKWLLDSTNKNQPGFRYIVQIYNAGSLLPINLIAEMDIAPDPFDNRRGDVDVSRIVRNKVDKFKNLNVNTVQNALGTFYTYDIRFGESFTTSWPFDDYIFITGAFTGLTTDNTIDPLFSNIPHGFQVGDQIYVEMNVVYNDCRDVITGFYTVLEVVSPQTIKINLEFPCSGPASPGTVRYADNRTTRTFNLTSQIRRGVINASQDIIEYTSQQGSMALYQITNISTDAKLLTNIPYGFKVATSQHLWLNQFELASNAPTDNGVSIKFTNSNGDVFTKNNVGIFFVKQTGIGPANLGTLALQTGTAPLIKPDTEWYDVFLINSSNLRVSEIKRFYIDRRCPINDIEIAFMDRKGSFMSYYFPLRKFEFIDTKKDMYNKYVKTTITSSDGLQVYNSEYKETWRLNTNWITDDMNKYFEELLTSPYTYIRYENNWYSCKIIDGNFETEKTRNKRLVKRSVDLVFDINTPVNI